MGSGRLKRTGMVIVGCPEVVVFGAALLETDKVDRGVVIEKARIEDLPLSMQNPIMLSNLSAGIVNSGDGVNVNPFSNSSISSWSVNGSMTNNVEFTMDGAPNNAYSGALNRIAYVPPSEAVQEFKIVTTMFDASLGRSNGGALSITTKSGTNEYHGSAFYYTQNEALNANAWENNRVGIPHPVVDMYSVGGTVGGPVRLPKYDGRNRTFFFFGYERDLNGNHVSGLAFTPTASRKRFGSCG